MMLLLIARWRQEKHTDMWIRRVWKTSKGAQMDLPPENVLPAFEEGEAKLL